jgi:hypothetical protein
MKDKMFKFFKFFIFFIKYIVFNKKNINVYVVLIRCVGADYFVVVVNVAERPVNLYESNQWRY